MTPLDIEERRWATRLRMAAVVSWLKTYRHLTDGEIAIRLGVPRTTAMNWMRGTRGVEIHIVEALADALEVPAHVLLMELPDVKRWMLRQEVGDDPATAADRRSGQPASVTGDPVSTDSPTRCSHSATHTDARDAWAA